jgi:hypothetical protein
MIRGSFGSSLMSVTTSKVRSNVDGRAGFRVGRTARICPAAGCESFERTASSFRTWAVRACCRRQSPSRLEDSFCCALFAIASSCSSVSDRSKRRRSRARRTRSHSTTAYARAEMMATNEYISSDIDDESGRHDRRTVVLVGGIRKNALKASTLLCLWCHGRTSGTFSPQAGRRATCSVSPRPATRPSSALRAPSPRKRGEGLPAVFPLAPLAVQTGDILNRCPRTWWTLMPRQQGRVWHAVDGANDHVREA